jgi:hypothetical protein
LQRITQKLEDITDKLQRIESAWRNGVSDRIVQELVYLKKRIDEESHFNEVLIRELLEKDFKSYLSIFRLFLEYSKDEFEGLLREAIPNGIGSKSFGHNNEPFVKALVNLRLIEAIESHTLKKWAWTDVIIERLKLGRGSAIKGQKRGRFLEKKVEAAIKEVFSNKYDKNCNFLGLDSKIAKAEFAIPSKDDPCIVFEAKAYGATGSKQTDVIGDIEKITKAKKHNTYFLFVTDGITWRQRLSDLKKIIKFQNDGYIQKIYTLSMIDELKDDLRILKAEFGL